MILNENEEYKKFIEQILKNIGFDINNPENLSGLGYYYFEIGKYEEATKYLLKAVESNNNDSKSWQWLGISYNKNGEFEKSIFFNICSINWHLL